MADVFNHEPSIAPPTFSGSWRQTFGQQPLVLSSKFSAPFIRDCPLERYAESQEDLEDRAALGASRRWSAKYDSYIIEYRAQCGVRNIRNKTSHVSGC